MAFNRRGILGLVAGAPIFGNAVAENIGRDAGMGAMRLGIGANAPGAAQGYNQPTPPLMEHKSAIRMIFGDAAALAEIRDELFAQNRTITAIDPDILVMKAWSTMAKLTFQRQRNVERALAELQENRMDCPQRYVRAFNDRLQKLMWS